MKPKILVIDIETLPMEGAFWELRETNPIWIDKQSSIIGFSAKWIGGSQMTRVLPDYPHYRPGKRGDKKLILDIWNLLDRADIVMGHNSKRFDIKRINAEFIKIGLNPPAPYKQLDTLQELRRHFGFPSYKLAYVAPQLSVGDKMENEGAELWRKCRDGEMKSWNKMKRYVHRDVGITAGVYEKILPFIENHPAPKLRDKIFKNILCDNCGKPSLQSRGTQWRGGENYMSGNSVPRADIGNRK